MLNLVKKNLCRHNSPIYAYEMGNWEGTYSESSTTNAQGCTVITQEWDYVCASEPDKVFCTAGSRDKGSRTITDC